MKKSIKFMAMLLCAAMVFGVASCDRNDDTTNNDGNGDGNGDDSGVSCGETRGEWVDLGLPSGILWYSVNIGATSPEQYGCYFAWGETTAKENYSWDTYIWHIWRNGAGYLTKYNTDVSCGTVDNKTVLEASDDVATAVLGNGARIPTTYEWNELLNNTTSELTTQNGVAGRKFTAANGNSIFLPIAGFRYDSELIESGYGHYWSSTLYVYNYLGHNPFNAHTYKPGVVVGGDAARGRSDGLSVRAVRASQN